MRYHKGTADTYKDVKKKHIITTQIEHKCVLSSCRELEMEGVDVTYLPVGKDGLIDTVQLEEEIREGETALVSIMYVNNEIGVMQPMEEIGRICKKHKVIFHTDAAQAIGRFFSDIVLI